MKVFGISLEKMMSQQFLGAWFAIAMANDKREIT